MGGLHRSGPDGFFQIFRVPLGEGEPEQVTSDPTHKTEPAWSPLGPNRVHGLQLPGALLADPPVLAPALTASELDVLPPSRTTMPQPVGGLGLRHHNLLWFELLTDPALRSYAD